MGISLGWVVARGGGGEGTAGQEGRWLVSLRVKAMECQVTSVGQPAVNFVCQEESEANVCTGVGWVVLVEIEVEGRTVV